MQLLYATNSILLILYSLFKYLKSSPYQVFEILCYANFLRTQQKKNEMQKNIRKYQLERRRTKYATKSSAPK